MLSLDSPTDFPESKTAKETAPLDRHNSLPLFGLI
jgi:hypothetical protein